MGSYDTFIDSKNKQSVQIKALNCDMREFVVGDTIPMEEGGLPKTCTLAAWGGTSKLFSGLNILQEREGLGVFVLIREGSLRE